MSIFNVSIFPGSNPDLVIQAAIKQRADEVYAEELEAAKLRIEQRMQKELGSIVLSLFKQYECHHNGVSLSISVNNQLGGRG